MSSYRHEGTFTLMPDIDPDQFDGPAEKGTRYSDALWSAIRLEWEADPAVSYAKALKIVAARLEVPVPSKGACLTYAKRNGWTKSTQVPAQTRPTPPKPKVKVERPATERRASLPKISSEGLVPPLDGVERIVADEVLDREVTPQAGYEEFGITIKEALYVDYYLINFNATWAYREAGYTAKTDQTASVCGARLLRKPAVALYLRSKLDKRFENIDEEQNRIMQAITYVAYADPNELVEHRIDSCRYCHGTEHQYQWTEQEFARACDSVRAWNSTPAGHKKPKAYPVALGGMGFNPNTAPHEECPECFGRGVPVTIIKDTRYLSTAARFLYAGVKEGKEGLEVKMNSQDRARETIAKIRRLYDDSVKVTFEFDPDILEKRFGEKMRAAHERALEVRQERLSNRTD